MPTTVGGKKHTTSWPTKENRRRKKQKSPEASQKVSVRFIEFLPSICKRNSGTGTGTLLVYKSCFRAQSLPKVYTTEYLLEWPAAEDFQVHFDGQSIGSVIWQGLKKNKIQEAVSLCHIKPIWQHCVCVKKSETVIRHDLGAITTWYSKVWHANKFWVVLGKIAAGQVIEKHS